MRPSEEEINDAIRRKLQSSLKDFESKPHADMDRKMHQLLNKAPSFKQPYMLWGIVGLLFFLGTGVLICTDRFQSDEPAGANGDFRPRASILDKASKQTHTKNEVLSTDETKNKIPGYVNREQRGLDGKILGSKTVIEKRNTDLAIGNTESYPVLPTDIGAKQKQGRSNAPANEVNDQIDSQEIKQTSGHHTGKESNHEASGLQVSLRSVLDTLENKENIRGNDMRKPGTLETSLELISLRAILTNPSKIHLPEISYPKGEVLASFPKVKTDSLHRKIYLNWSALKKISIVFTVTPFQTLQQVSVFSRSGSRIQNVELEGSLSTLGYKFGAGLQKGGFQLLANFTKINTHLNYAYASDEFKVVEKSPNEFEIRRLGVVQSENKSSSLLGLGVKKQIDFTSRNIGRFYTTAGVEYSRFLGKGAGGLLFVNLSSGKSFPIHYSSSISVGPYFEYSFGKIKAADQQIAIRPSQVGLSVQLKLGQDK